MNYFYRIKLIRIRVMIEIIECDFEKPKHCKAVIDLMNHYMTDKMGGELQPHDAEKAKRMIEGLKNHPSRLVLLAIYEREYVGLSTAFINYGTFAAKPFLNIHDVVVLDQYRGIGIGRKLMEANSAKAEQLDCSKITLEVRKDNTTAQALYKNLGFGDSDPVMYFWTKYSKNNH
ncbi:MAG: GNAT family N-acetyltransferase [Bacteroidales bacterium]|nr:GNAT family N-acetyltransferase [Bacteroidales bacterium]